ncbi:MAG: folate-binding protein YgfZ [Caulobacteraceae bacterium]|nr:folate-binding protein YgfZ [Caulobacteraceae bacterium]
MTIPQRFAPLDSRALIAVSGPDWRGFLQGLLTQDVETLSAGEARFAALLTPQGKLLFDLFVIGRGDGCLIDVAADRRAALIQRLTLYRLRAKVEIAPLDEPVLALWPAPAGDAPEGWSPDPRLPALGLRGYGVCTPSGAIQADEAAYDAWRLGLGAPDPARDAPSETTYPIEANFDLLGGIDFKKGCFVGQETTSRMKRRGTIKTRMLPIAFDGPPPAFGAEVLAGSLRAGEVRSGADGRAMALLRLDRIEGAELTVDGRPVRVERPGYLAGEAAA